MSLGINTVAPIQSSMETTPASISSGYPISSRVFVNASDAFKFDDLSSKQGFDQEPCSNRAWSSTNTATFHTSSSNTTENVRVASSFHVAEIVGKQGIKIKRVRAMTNTWIKTPARGQDPVFVISGRKEGVEQAKAEILSAAEKVARLRALRSHVSGDPEEMDSEMSPISPNGANSIQVKVSVAANTVGLIIGPKGARIKEIAEKTNTYIKTPCKYREPVFEVVGSPEDAYKARKCILSIIYDKMNDDHIKMLMTHLPIHEPGSPVTLGEEAKPLSAHLSTPRAPSPVNPEFTQLRSLDQRCLPSLNPEYFLHSRLPTRNTRTPTPFSLMQPSDSSYLTGDDNSYASPLLPPYFPSMSN